MLISASETELSNQVSVIDIIATVEFEAISFSSNIFGRRDLAFICRKCRPFLLKHWKCSGSALERSFVLPVWLQQLSVSSLWKGKSINVQLQQVKLKSELSETIESYFWVVIKPEHLIWVHCWQLSQLTALLREVTPLLQTIHGYLGCRTSFLCSKLFGDWALRQSILSDLGPGWGWTSPLLSNENIKTAFAFSE